MTTNPINTVLDSFVRISLLSESVSDRDAIRATFLPLKEGETFDDKWEATPTKAKKRIHKAVTLAVTESAARLVSDPKSGVKEAPSERTVQRIVGKRLGFSMRKHVEATPEEVAVRLAARLVDLCSEHGLDVTEIIAKAQILADEEGEQ